MTGSHHTDHVADSTGSSRVHAPIFKCQPREVYLKLGNQLRGERADLEHRHLLSRPAKSFPSSESYGTGRAAPLPRRRTHGTRLSHEYARYADRHGRTVYDHARGPRRPRRAAHRRGVGAAGTPLPSRRPGARRSPQDRARTRSLRVPSLSKSLADLGGVCRVILKPFFSRGRSVFERVLSSEQGRTAGRHGSGGASDGDRSGDSSPLLSLTVDEHTHTRQTNNIFVAVLSTPTVNRHVLGGGVDV